MRAPSAWRQLWLLTSLWWRHMRRRPVRLGDAPRVSGVPTALLLNLLSTCYFALIAWQSVVRDVGLERATFVAHLSAVLMLGLSAGALRGAGRLQVRGMRDDRFLEALPLRSAARAGLQLIDAYWYMPLALVVPLAAAFARGAFGASALGAALLGWLAFVASFVVGLAVISWARVPQPPALARYASYAAVVGNVVGLLGIALPFAGWMKGRGSEAAEAITRAWIGPNTALVPLYAAVIACGGLAYRALRAAERAGFDQLEPQRSAPRPHAHARDRDGLEWVMVLRQGGRATLIGFTVIAFGAAASVAFLARHRNAPVASRMLLGSAAFAVYLGAVLTVSRAASAARNDLLARPFLAALPLSPHQVLDGKARALRRLLVPLAALLALVCALFLARREYGDAYRALLSLVALYVAVDGAVSVAFLSTGLGVAGVGGAQPGSSFSVQILMLPLMATVLAPSDWSATTAFIALIAIRHEARRAARTSVRWLDDPGDDLERETTVWRALLAATAFFAMQALSFRVLDLFDVASGYVMAVAFANAAAVLALLTWRNGARFERPRFLPERAWYWPLGALAGVASGLLALEIARRWPPSADGSALQPSSGELVAMFCTTTLIAPLVEEYFFRGWLQRAIAADLPPSHKRWAFALAAAAFALAHFGSYGVPQFVLGLLAGGLFALSGGLWPGILAHAVHNGVVLLVGR
jgi:membrane protease YdiL (CAAX protease family)